MGGLLHMSHAAGTKYNHQPGMARDDCTRSPYSGKHQAEEFCNLPGMRTGQWTGTIIDQSASETRLPGWSCTSVRMGHDDCHVMTSHMQTKLIGQMKTTRRLNVAEHADRLHKRPVSWEKVVGESIPFLGGTTTAWMMLTMTKQTGDLIVCLRSNRAELELFCKHVGRQNARRTEGYQVWRSRWRARWRARRRSSRATQSDSH